MRLQPTPGISRRARRPEFTSTFLLIVACGVSSATIFAADADPDTVSRLGFKFDQQAHDAAMEADRKHAAANEPLPAGVIRLPRHNITARKAPETSHLLTLEGRIKLAEDRFETPLYQAVIGPLTAVASFVHNVLGGWNPNAREALALQADEDQFRRNQELNDLLELGALADQTKGPPIDDKQPKAQK